MKILRWDQTSLFRWAQNPMLWVLTRDRWGDNADTEEKALWRQSQRLEFAFIAKECLERPEDGRGKDRFSPRASRARGAIPAPRLGLPASKTVRHDIPVVLSLDQLTAVCSSSLRKLTSVFTCVSIIRTGTRSFSSEQHEWNLGGWTETTWSWTLLIMTLRCKESLLKYDVLSTSKFVFALESEAALT